MTKKELKYVNSLKEENERVKTLLLRFADAVGKLTNIADVANMMLIPIMVEQNKKFREEIKAEARKEFAESLKKHERYATDVFDHTKMVVVRLEDIDNVLEKMEEYSEE